MNLHMIITISGIFIGMIILIYGIYSYEKLKEDETSKTKDSISENEQNNNSNIAGEELINNEPEINETLKINKHEKEDKDRSIIEEEPAIKISEIEENNLEDTLVFDEKEENPEKDIENLFD